MTTIATDGRSMAGDGQCCDHTGSIVNTSKRKVVRLTDGRIAGAAGNSFDIASWIGWLNGGKDGACPVVEDVFVGLILNLDGSVSWVDWKGRETAAPTPCAVGSGQNYALGALEFGASPEAAVAIACRRDPYSGGDIAVESL